jgi:hypothetical protein
MFASATPASSTPWRSSATSLFEPAAGACPSSALCVVAAWGEIVSSTDPLRGPWKVVNVGSDRLTSVSCPTASFCVAVSDRGDAYVSTDPGGGADAWIRTSIDAPENGLDAVSCPTATMCVAVDDAGNAIVAHSPRVLVRARAVSLPVSCSRIHRGSCRFALSVSVRRPVRRLQARALRTRRVTVGHRTVTLRPGASVTVRIVLNTRLLPRRHRLAATLTIRSASRVVFSRPVTLRPRA